MSLSGGRFDQQIADVAAARRVLREHIAAADAERRRLTLRYADAITAASEAGMPRKELARMFNTTEGSMTQVVHRARRERSNASVIELDSARRRRQ